MSKKTSNSKPTGKTGCGVQPSNRCCACRGSGRFRFDDGRVVDCTNCVGTGRQ